MLGVSECEECHGRLATCLITDKEVCSTCGLIILLREDRRKCTHIMVKHHMRVGDYHEE